MEASRSRPSFRRSAPACLSTSTIETRSVAEQCRMLPATPSGILLGADSDSDSADVQSDNSRASISRYLVDRCRDSKPWACWGLLRRQFGDAVPGVPGSWQLGAWDSSRQSGESSAGGPEQGVSAGRRG